MLELEREFGLQQVRDHNRDRKIKPPTYNEDQQARRKGQQLHEKRVAIRDAWECSDNGQSFTAAISEAGFVIAQGDRRDFVLVDELGSVYTIGKRTTGASAADVRAKLQDLDREQLPTVEEAKTIQRERMQEREADRTQQAESTGDFLEHQAAAKKERQADELEAAQGAPEEAALERETAKVAHTAEQGLDKGAKIAGRVVDGALKAVGGIVDFLVPPPPETPQQRRAREKAYIERLMNDAEFRAAERTRMEEAAKREGEEREQKQARENTETERERRRLGR
jgi:hypothetical protein